MSVTPNRDAVNLGSDEVLITGTVFGVLAAVAVFLRFFTKIRNPTGHFGWDDWWILIACLLFWVEDGLQIAATRTAQRPDFDKQAVLVHWLKLQYATTQLYTITACLVKISILCLYRHLFATRLFHLVSLSVMILCVLWAVGCGFAEIFECNPPSHFWNPDLKGVCVHYGKSLVAVLSLEIALDATILSLPIRMVLGLQMSLAKKVQVSLIFLIGGFAVVTNVFRIAFAYDAETDGDRLWLDQLWLNIHLGTSIICACLPTYGPLIQELNLKATSILLWHRADSVYGASSTTAQPTSLKGASKRVRTSSHYGNTGEWSEEDIHLNDRNAGFA